MKNETKYIGNANNCRDYANNECNCNYLRDCKLNKQLASLPKSKEVETPNLAEMLFNAEMGIPAIS